MGPAQNLKTFVENNLSYGIMSCHKSCITSCYITLGYTGIYYAMTQNNCFVNGPRQANLILIAYASSEGSGEPTHICAVLPEPPLLAQTSRESRGTFRQKARSLAPLNDWACAVKICHDRMLEDTNSLDGAQMGHINMTFIHPWKIKHVSTDQINTTLLFWFEATWYNKQIMPIKVILCDVIWCHCVTALHKQAEGQVKFDFTTNCIDTAAILYAEQLLWLLSK